MRHSFFLLGLILFPTLGISTPIVGTWRSDCQNLPNDAEGFHSMAPIDSFHSDLTATLRVHVFREPHCKGEEWDHLVIPCTYRLGGNISGLAETYELDLACEFEGKSENWYEIAEPKAATLRFGNKTGMTPDERPQTLGNVVYRRMR